MELIGYDRANTRDIFIGFLLEAKGVMSMLHTIQLTL